MAPDPAVTEGVCSDPEVDADVAWHCPAFAGPLEREFLEQGARVWVRIARNWLLEVLGLGVVMVWGAALSGPRAAAAALVLQASAGVPAVLVALLLPRVPVGWRREAVFGAAALVVVAAIAVQGWWMSAELANRYVMAGGLALFSILLVVPLRLSQSAALGVLGMAVLVPVTLLSPNPAQRACWDLLVFTALTLPLGLRVRAGAERDQRTLFLLRRREELGRQALLRANARLQGLSETDPLTGVANRRSFDAALRRALDPAVAGRPSLLLLDVDHFKRFNDTYGHPQGDECLRLVAGAARGQLRGSGDLAARIGGEEFAVLLPGGTALDGATVAERIRLAAEALQLPHAGRPDLPPVVTVSVGVAAAVPGDTAETLTSRADEALYAAKIAGRNRVHVAEYGAEHGAEPGAEQIRARGAPAELVAGRA